MHLLKGLEDHLNSLVYQVGVACLDYLLPCGPLGPCKTSCWGLVEFLGIFGINNVNLLALVGMVLHVHSTVMRSGQLYSVGSCSPTYLSWLLCSRVPFQLDCIYSKQENTCTIDNYLKQATTLKIAVHV